LIDRISRSTRQVCPWRWLFDKFEPVNQARHKVGLGFLPRARLGDFTWALPAAGALIVAAPILALYLVLHRRFTGAVLSGAIKG
jgi:ABC-type glycerol-3-phosphate transport system permease component